MAISSEVRAKYKPTIGIETHVQLKTKTKLFSAVGNDARQAEPNSLISHIDIALPGALPVLNEKAIELATRTAFALNTKPQKYSYFERKHYFYPDSPAGYQISQLKAPIIVGGSVEVETEGQKRSISINRVQLEADAGKTIHPEGTDYSLVDLNRAGTPLLEIVSEPEINSPQEAKAFARELYLLMKYADVSDVDLYHGNMRFDVNVSVSKDEAKGIRTEIKNLNSFRSVEGAVAYEIDRQIELLEKGEAVVQETRGWDEAKQKTTGQRIKEEAHDYRYMPEPDIPPLELSQKYFDDVSRDLPVLSPAIREELNKLSISKNVVEDILDRPSVVRNVLEVLEKGSAEDARLAVFLLLAVWPDEEDPLLKERVFHLDHLLRISEMLQQNLISSNSAQKIFYVSMERGIKPDATAQEMNLLQISETSEIEKIVARIIADNPKPVEEIKAGERKAIGFLVGQVMAATQGRANPGLAQEIIKKQLGL
jgi:aspartyl-tRNA(Asn)/glutamyl-tRNA(Gln) amidotransferase subunit B